jgi:predicted dehydrogenase
MPIGVGILGFAHGHVSAYCQQWRDRPELDTRAVAGWDHDAGRLQAAVNAHGVRPFSDVKDLLADPEVQAVVVSSETSYHPALVEQAAAAGKAIILQKPAALTLPEADRIVSAVKQHGVPFTMAWQMRVDPQNVKMKELLQAGTLGRVFMVRRRHTLSTHLWANFADLWHNKPELNRDIFADDAAHAIDFILWLLGKPDTVTAELATICDPRVPNDNGIAIFRYAGGPIAEVVGSFVSPAGENTTEVTAERGNIVQNYGDAPTAAAPRPDGSCGLKWYSVDSGAWTYSDIPSPTSQGFRIAGLAEPLAEFLHGKRPALATAEEGRTALRMTLACYVSSREGRRVSLDDAAIDLVPV